MNLLNPRPVLTALTAALFAMPVGRAARLYFTDQPASSPGSVISVALDGSSQSTVITIPGTPDLRGIAWHRGSGRIFVLDNGAAARKIFCVRPDGTGAQDITPVSATLLNADLEMDEAGGKLYWAENNAGTSGNGFIRRANLDGSGIETALTTAPGTTTAPYFFFLDPAAGWIYWGVISGGNGPSSYRRASLGGLIDPDFLITTTTRTRDITVDSAAGMAYWCDRQTGTIFRRALAGSANETVISGLNAPHGIALDLEAGKIYWADTGGRGSPSSGLSARRVARCNLDGSEFENLSTPTAVSEPWDLALDIASATYADWRTRFFSVTTPAAGPLDDADNDGAANLLEYALVSHPRRAGSLPRIEAEGAAMRYSRRESSNLSYRVQVSTDLAHWHFNGDDTSLVWTVENAVTPLGPEVVSVLVAPGPALAAASAVFYRVQVTAP